jgi:hypothetical protein
MVKKSSPALLSRLPSFFINWLFQESAIDDIAIAKAKVSGVLCYEM